MKVAQYEVLGNSAKETSVPDGTKEVFLAPGPLVCSSAASPTVDRPVRDGSFF